MSEDQLLIGDTDTLDVEFYEELVDEDTGAVTRRDFDPDDIQIVIRDRFRKPKVVITNNEANLADDIKAILADPLRQTSIILYGEDLIQKTGVNNIRKVVNGCYEFDATWPDELFVYLEYRYLYEDNWRTPRYALDLVYAYD